MAAKKPLSLHSNPAKKGKAYVKEREAAENAFQTKKNLSIRPPAALKGRKIAESVWRRLVRALNELENSPVNRLDTDILTIYCILTEELSELDQMRQATWQAWLKKEGEGKGKTENKPGQDNLVEQMTKIDGRRDRKLGLLHQISQTMYLTPRSRAGVMPKAKQPFQEKDDLDKLLDQFEGLTGGEFK